MRYFRIRMLHEIQNGEDMLGNPVKALEASEKCYRGGFTVWTADEVQLVGRDVTKSQRKMITDAPLTVCQPAVGVRTEPEDYRILSVSDLNGRWRLLIVERWKVRKCKSN